MLRKNAGATTAAVLSLALSIGACTAAFSMIDAFFIRPLPVRDPAKLVFLLHSHHEWSSDYDSFFSRESFDSIVQASRRQMDLFGLGWAHRPVRFEGSGAETEDRQIQFISGDGFRVLGINPALGRVLTSADDGHAVAVLSHTLWTDRFGADPNVLGRWVELDGKPFQIIGVAQKGFGSLFRGYRIDFWVPDNGYPEWEMVLGYSKPGVTHEQARQVLQAAFTNYRREHREEFARFGASREALQDFLNERLDFRPPNDLPTGLHTEWERPLLTLAAVAGLVLLIACSNVANLLVARAAARDREMALRLSIGAGRMRLIQQLLIESALVAGAGCILGLAVASVFLPPIVSLMSPSNKQIFDDVRLSLRILPFLALVGVATTVLFGLAPALRACAVSPQESLKAGGRTHSGRSGILGSLLVFQVGFSFTVLLVGGLLVTSFHKLTHVDLGFSKDGVLLMDLSAKIPDREKARAVELELLDRIRHLPGVQAASMSDSALLQGRRPTLLSVRFPGRAPEVKEPAYKAVSPGFFETMQIPILNGRDLRASDLRLGSTAVVVNQEFVRQYLPGESPVGQRFQRSTNNHLQPIVQEIVGVVRNAKDSSLREPDTPMVFEPLVGIQVALEVRTVGNPFLVVPAIRQTIQLVHPQLRFGNVMSESMNISNAILREKLLALLAVFFALVAVVLAAIGLYGVLSYSVVRRTKELGIRFAMGASRFGVVRVIVSDVMLLIGIGLAAGMLGGLALERPVVALLFEVKLFDFWSLVLPLACLLVASGLATMPSAFRAMRVDPIVALREE